MDKLFNDNFMNDNLFGENKNNTDIEGFDILEHYRNNYIENYNNHLDFENLLEPFFKTEENITYEKSKSEESIKKLYFYEKSLKIAEIQYKMESRFYDRMRNLYENNLKKYSNDQTTSLKKDIDDIYFQYKTSEPHVIKYRNKIKEIKEEIQKIKKELKN